MVRPRRRLRPLLLLGAAAGAVWAAREAALRRDEPRIAALTAAPSSSPPTPTPAPPPAPSATAPPPSAPSNGANGSG